MKSEMDLEDFHVGDRVIAFGDIGQIVFSTLNGEFKKGFEPEKYVEAGDEGVMVQTDNGALLLVDAVRSDRGEVLIELI